MSGSFWTWFLRTWGHACGWSLGFALTLAGLMVAVGVILLAGAFLGWAWDIFRGGV